MTKKTSKHGAAKRVAAPARRRTSPATHRTGPPSPTTLRIIFYRDSVGGHSWQALRSGSVVMQSAGTYVKKDKMKRALLRLVESFRSGDWVATDEER